MEAVDSSLLGSEGSTLVVDVAAEDVDLAAISGASRFSFLRVGLMDAVSEFRFRFTKKSEICVWHWDDLLLMSPKLYKARRHNVKAKIQILETQNDFVTSKFV